MAFNMFHARPDICAAEVPLVLAEGKPQERFDIRVITA
jgi:hypothetical protein